MYRYIYQKNEVYVQFTVQTKFSEKCVKAKVISARFRFAENWMMVSICQVYTIGTRQEKLNLASGRRIQVFQWVLKRWFSIQARDECSQGYRNISIALWWQLIWILRIELWEKDSVRILVVSSIVPQTGGGRGGGGRHWTPHRPPESRCADWVRRDKQPLSPSPSR